MNHVNYFNYFTEIEDTFIRRRGKHLLLSPMDWALIESWKEMGVPLHVALRGIEQAFDSYEAKPRKRSVKTLMYCQEEVEAQYEEWRESHVGASPDDAGDEKPGIEQEQQLPFSREAILAHISRAIDGLALVLNARRAKSKDEFCETLSRIVERLNELKMDFENAARPNAERLEDSLTSLEKLLDEALLNNFGSEELAASNAETHSQLNSYRKRMDAAMYKQTFDTLLLKRLREKNDIPRLSLFFL